MIDDHDGCKYVNVSSGTGSPGLSQTKSREQAVQRFCVCVCVCVLLLAYMVFQRDSTAD